MPAYNNADALLLDQFTRSPGRTIWVNRATGSDTAGLGDGSNALPYRTLGRAVQDLRSGRNDTIVVVGNLTGESRVRIDGVNNFRVIGLGTVWDAAGTSPLSTIYTPSTSAAAPVGGHIRYTVTSHPFVVGDYVIQWRGIGQAGTRPNTVARVNTVPNANQFDVEAPQRGAAFPNAQEPATTMPHLAIRNATNVVVQGITFEANPVVADQWGGLVFDGCRNVYVAECTFGNATLGLVASTIILGTLSAAGTNLLVERCRFAPTTLDLFAPLGAEAPSIMVRGTIEARFVGCLMTSFHRNASNVDAGWAEGGGEGFIHFATNPGLGATFVGCTAINRFGQPLGGTPPDYTSLVHLDDPNQNGGLGRVFWRGNFFQDATTGEPVSLDDVQGLRDQEPATIPNQDYVPTWGELMWRRRLQDAIDVPGSMGESVARLAYEGSIHIDPVNGSPGTVVGLNGLEENPVDNLADARVLADALGFRSYHFHGGPLTVTVDHLDWTFEGVTPSDDAVVIDSGADVAGSQFLSLGVRGDFSGTTGDVSAQQCIVGTSGGTTRSVRGVFDTCNWLGTIVPAPGQRLSALRPVSNDINGTVFDLEGGAGPIQVLLGEAVGIFAVANMDQANHVLGASLNGAKLTLGATVTNGIVEIGGIGTVLDQKGAAETAFTQYHNNVVSRPDVRVRIDQATDPWQEVVEETDGVERERFELYDQDGNAINNANPLGSTNVTFVGERRRLAD